MRSVVVVLPASICAMMPIFRYRSRAVVRAINETPRRHLRRRPQRSHISDKWSAARCLPAVVREGLIRVGHPMRIFPPLHRDATIIGSVEEFTREPFLHRVFRAIPRTRDEPPNSQRLATVRSYFDRNLIGGAADAPGANLDRGAHVVESVMKDAQRILPATFGDSVECVVDDPFGYRFLALPHQAVHEFGQYEVAKLRIRENLAFDRSSAARHRASPTSDVSRRISNGADGDLSHLGYRACPG